MIRLTLVFHVHHSQFFWFSSLPSLHDYNVKFPDVTIRVTCELQPFQSLLSRLDFSLITAGDQAGKGGGGREGETTSGTEKRCFHKLQSGRLLCWSTDNCKIFSQVTFFRSEKRIGTLWQFEMEYRR